MTIKDEEKVIHAQGHCPTAEMIEREKTGQLNALKQLRGLLIEAECKLPEHERRKCKYFELCWARGLQSEDAPRKSAPKKNPNEESFYDL